MMMTKRQKKKKDVVKEKYSSLFQVSGPEHSPTHDAEGYQWLRSVYEVMVAYAKVKKKSSVKQIYRSHFLPAVEMKNEEPGRKLASNMLGQVEVQTAGIHYCSRRRRMQKGRRTGVVGIADADAVADVGKEGA